MGLGGGDLDKNFPYFLIFSELTFTPVDGKPGNMVHRPRYLVIHMSNFLTQTAKEKLWQYPHNTEVRSL